jgi:hypothetical protein
MNPLARVYNRTLGIFKEFARSETAGKNKYLPHNGARKALREIFNKEISTWLPAQRRLARQLVAGGMSHSCAAQTVVIEDEENAHFVESVRDEVQVSATQENVGKDFSAFLKI